MCEFKQGGRKSCAIAIGMPRGDCRKGKKCRSSEICNPESGRCVQRKGKTGQKVLAQADKVPAPPVAIAAPAVSPCRKPCGSDQICNAKTGRCVLRKGKVGMALLAAQAQPAPVVLAPAPRKPVKLNPQFGGCWAPCKPTEICNPKSGRCVLRTGKIGKELLVKAEAGPERVD
jgi:hypothetical protein